MRIAVFTECYRPIVNGVVVSVATLAGELTKQGHEVHIIAPAFPGYRELDPNVHRLPSVCPPIRPRYPIALPFGSRRLRSVFASHPPDVIHVQHPFSTGREGRRWARRLNRPLVFTYHTLIRSYAHYVPLPQPLVRAAAVWVSREFPNSTDFVIVPTPAIADILRGYGVRRPMEAIPTGIDLDLIRGGERRPARKKLGVPRGAPLIAYSGRIAREKSIDVVLRAFALVSSRQPEAHLLLIGGGPWYEPCRALADSLGVGERVHVTGYVDRERVFDFLAESDLFAFASLTDTQGVAVLEAMALGCPPVAVRSGAVEDVIRDGVDGLLVEPDAGSLAEGLLQVLESRELRERLAGRARVRAEDFSAGRMAARVVEVYQKVL